jgi:DNA-binding LytR/AlgR family response regulator
MKAIHAKLGEEDFLRVHRSFIVALNKIDSMQENTLAVGTKTVKVSRKYKKELKERLKSRID